MLVKHEQRTAALKKSLETARKKLTVLRQEMDRAESRNANGRRVKVEELPGIVVDDSEATAVGEWKVSQYTPQFVGTGYRHDLSKDRGAKTLTFVPKLPESGRYEVRFAYPSAPNRATNVPVHVFHSGGQERVVVNEREQPGADGRFTSLGIFEFEKDGAGYVLVSNEGADGYVCADAIQFIPEGQRAEVAKRDANETADETRAADALTREVKDLEGTLKELQAHGPVRPMVMSVFDDPEPGDTPVRVRGVEAQKGETVPRGFLQVLEVSARPEGFSGSGRRELAKWLTNRDNPLTARVFVNRVWHWLFGAGIVRSTDNFGTTGTLPSHPELLDFLAIHFMKSGWKPKALIRDLVLSRAWQTASTATTDADPDNQWLAHTNLRRLDAEQIRDAILCASGHLDRTVGGPNIKGASVIDANSTGAQNLEYQYKFEDTRRGVYTPAFRNKRHELFEIFDFGNVNAPLGARSVSTVAPQALYLLNASFVIEEANHCAQRVCLAPEQRDDEIRTAFLASLGCEPGPREMGIAREFLLSTDASEAELRERWSEFYQSLFGSIEFRYLE
ncbi:MAG: DUF1553 domain-containing protein [Chthoniobacteraceae bacterium]